MKVNKSGKEEKEGNKRKQKGKDKFGEGKSDISALTTNTNKTTSGALKRHCEPCGKLVTNWSQHKKDVHDDSEVPFTKCDASCTKCTVGK